MDIQMILGGLYFMVLGYWWMAEAAKRYYHCKQRHIEFHATITYPCCHSCHRWPIESIIKLTSCIALIIFGILEATDFGKASLRCEMLQQATVFAFFAFSSIIDIILVCRGKLFIENLDYAILALTFGVQAVMSGFHIPDSTAQEWTVSNLLLITAFGCCVATVAEMKFRNQVYCTLLRALSITLLGTWMIQSSILLSDPIPVPGADSHHRVVLLSMYFTWHCAINFTILLSIWLLVTKCYNYSTCCCLPVFNYNISDETVFMENRVRFDYHMLDRLELEVD